MDLHRGAESRGVARSKGTAQSGPVTQVPKARITAAFASAPAAAHPASTGRELSNDEAPFPVDLQIVAECSRRHSTAGAPDLGQGMLRVVRQVENEDSYQSKVRLTALSHALLKSDGTLG